jgi:hypothetical protein
LQSAQGFGNFPLGETHPWSLGPFFNRPDKPGPPLFPQVTLPGFHHGPEVFPFHVDRAFAPGGEHKAAALSHFIDQPLTIRFHFFRFSQGQEGRGNVPADAHVALQYLLGPENVRRSIQVTNAFSLRQFGEVREVDPPVCVQVQPGSNSLGQESIHVPLQKRPFKPLEHIQPVIKA